MNKRFYSIVPLGLVEMLHNSSDSYRVTSNFLEKIDPELLEKLSEKKALKIYKKAKKHIPAYKLVLKEKGIQNIRNISEFNKLLPYLDKTNYVRKYSLIERTEEHLLPKEGGMIVESSGSTSKYPTNWFRTIEEENDIRKDAKFESRYIFGNKEHLVISCWTLGAWTTSYSFCYAFEPFSVVKNIGPDVEQVVQTIKMFGTKPNYLIGGYPPFLKHLLDTGKVNWKKHKVDFVTGGEGFIPGWRDYIKSRVAKGSTIISSYGASDLETGMGVETPLTIYIRELLAKYPKKSKKVFGIEQIPHVFQYNPLRFYIENVEGEKEFHATVLTKGHVGVKVKYRIHDTGGKQSYNQLIQTLKETFPGFTKKYENIYKKQALKLPFIWVVGRSDDVISVDGVNIYPQQVEKSLLNNKTLYKKIKSFQISKVQYHEGEHHFLVQIHLQENVSPTKILEKNIKQQIEKGMATISKAYRLGMHDDSRSFKPYVRLFKYHTGPFKVDKIKNKYVKK